ncbi:hypothetical protein HHI36_023502 [Cryptolaemus montrouzieri]|uniref:Protein tipE n=1 Tax=Cryptolaemus montrouzieri TaxID=559131 RepID=A0ABD2PGQ5_9CUCU
MADTSKKKDLSLISVAESAKFYTSLCLGTTAILSVFAFLFLIPFVVDPSISSLMADFDPEPVTCVVTQHVYAEGLRNCSWASCREGCTKEATRCHQMHVNYSKIPFREWSYTNRSVEWDIVNTKIFINAEGCGYPPSVNCTEFAKQYGYHTRGTPFPCYYSKVYPEMVIVRYSWDDTLRQLILSLAIPNLLFAASIGVLSYWYCPGCGRSCHKYMHRFPAEDEEHFNDTTY